MMIYITKGPGKSVTLIIDKATAERIIDAVYPSPVVQGMSKGYIELVNFLLKD